MKYRSLAAIAVGLLTVLVGIGLFRTNSETSATSASATLPTTSPQLTSPQPKASPRTPTVLASERTIESANHGRSNLLDVLFSAEAEVPAVTADFLERWFASGRTNALDLLAARQAGQNSDFLRQALTNFPNDPRVLLAAGQFKESPEAERARLDRLKTADPENAIADYLSASNHLKEGRIEEALADLASASGKQRLDDYSLESALAAEELYLAAGFSPAESKAYGTSTTLLPQLNPLKGLAEELSQLQRNYLAAGNQEGAEDLARLGMQLGQRISSSSGARSLVAEFTGMTIEAQVLKTLPPEGQYDFVPGGIPRYLEQMNQHRAGLKESSRHFEDWMRQANDSEIMAYFDRMKMFGEAEALRWMESRRGSP